MSGVCSITTLIPGTVETHEPPSFPTIRFGPGILAPAFAIPAAGHQEVRGRLHDQVGILRCLTYEDEAGASLSFGVFITTQLPGGWAERSLDAVVRAQLLPQQQFGWPAYR